MRVLLIACLLAGCTSPFVENGDHAAALPSGCNAPDSHVDRSVETITIETIGPFELRIPVPVSDATSFETWLDIIGGSKELSEHGDVIRVTGSGDTSWCSLNVAKASCCAEGYLDASWSTEGFWLEVIEGSVTFQYEANSNYCGGSATLEANTTGWHEGNDWIAMWCQ